jgi:hypothetical protein
MALRGVMTRADRPKYALLADLGLELAEPWWVRELAPGPGRQATTSGSVAGGATNAGQVPTDAPASGVTVPSSAGSTPAATPRRSAVRYHVSRHHVASADRGSPRCSARRHPSTIRVVRSCGPTMWPTVRTPPAWRPRRSGSPPSYWSCPRFPARPGPANCPDPVGRWLRTSMSVGPSLIVAE